MFVCQGVARGFGGLRLDASARPAKILQAAGCGVDFQFGSCCDRSKSVQTGILKDIFFEQQCLFDDATCRNYNIVLLYYSAIHLLYSTVCSDGDAWLSDLL